MRAATTRVCWVASGIAVAVAFGYLPARADEAPWCAIKSEGYWDCQYSSADDCARRAGRSFCNENPRYRGAEPPRQRDLHSSPQRRR